MNVITIGKSEQCDIVINNEYVSRTHAEIRLEGNQYIYRDFSTNGTTVNGRPVNNREVVINEGDRVLLANRVQLPWVQVVSLLSRGGYVKGGDSGNVYPQNDDSGDPGTGLLIASYVFGLLGGWLGIVFSIILMTKKVPVNDGRNTHEVYKYKKSTRNAAIGSLALCIMMIIVSFSMM